ncbi:HAMP domain-containing histidine kinase [Flavobacterium psychrophilum]|uniref:sensor histidine kinase n=1 Tax=Flavobacterium psychrophilum TaxID=96345 RepID=UPI001C8F638B|nr:HAMP domain-containing sensor histidine kinase [Flavobacterium psychrophilum]EKT4499620.1 HAMP domain-containing histidine kinase [Flavobacterium psychrophilum]EKT4519971.1 HAMP domain-containing histidine kinase [Flavobacterium psychrophilum]ELV7524106.1 HAMP domain-containing histidine kinase [Flavobacterium psychrophilum]ELY2011169.1 HAMP domain-containing histidine kinase [Flavobacterium psychrophilum]ELY2017787.1 HAMP domain-containing histidine kinase [Flavobacterium psychrophilum]
MKTNKLNTIIVLGLIATIGILMAQLLWTKQAFTLEEKKFSQKAHIALLEVVKHLYEGTNHDLPAENPIKKIANDYYVVNIDNDFEAEILEYYLNSEFKKANLNTDFEYAMYNCQSDEMVYGNYVSATNKTAKKASVYFPKHKNLIYYFAIRFPTETSYLFNSLRFWFLLSIALIIVLLVYVYSIYTIIQQKKYSELQRDFINNMTHEFKTPLSSILIASNYLKQQESIKTDEKLEKYAQIIINQSNKLNNHIEKILNIAKWDNIPMALEKQKLEIITIINQVIENIKLKYETVDIKIKSQSDIIFINADEFHFSNLVYNILENAIKYADQKPEIIIHIFATKTHLLLQFIDNGTGISEKNIPFVFDKFYRITSQKTTEVNGFGLGLYYVKKVCILHQWKVFIKNNTKKGVTVSVQIKPI